MSIELLIVRDYDGTDLGIGHSDSGSPAGKINEIATRVNLLDVAGATGAPSGVTIVEAEGLRKLTMTLVDAVVPLVDNAAVVAYGSLQLCDLPEGVILHMGAVLDLDLTLSAAGVNADWDGDVGLGTTAADNGATLATTEQDLVPTTATPQAVASVTTANAQSTATEAGAVFDGTATAKDVFLNILVDDADHDVTSTPTNIIVNGTVTLHYANLGDY